MHDLKCPEDCDCAYLAPREYKKIISYKIDLDQLASCLPLSGMLVIIVILDSNVS